MFHSVRLASMYSQREREREESGRVAGFLYGSNTSYTARLGCACVEYTIMTIPSIYSLIRFVTTLCSTKAHAALSRSSIKTTVVCIGRGTPRLIFLFFILFEFVH
jgi:hypothetical protein